MRYFFLFLLLSGIAVLAAAGFRGSKSSRPPTEIFPDMDRQVKYKPQKTSDFFADGRVERTHVADTVPVGYARPEKQKTDVETPFGLHHGFTQGTDYLDTGKMGQNWGTGIPLKVDAAFIERGHQRFTINCAVCHGATGLGNGIASKYGWSGIANLHQPRLREMADGEIYNTIVHGKNTMMPYGDKVTREDRWAIVAYVRALQRAQNGTASDVPADVMAKLEAK